jgi:DNA-binding HxlR family transcriptional regulator
MDELGRALAFIGPKWTLQIIQELLDGPRRFTEIERSLGGANPKMVTVRLRDLVAAGLVSRTYYAEVPPRVEYALTERGRALQPAIDALKRWGSRASKLRSTARSAADHEIRRARRTRSGSIAL